MTTKSPVLEKVEEINESIETFKKTHDSKASALLDRIEQLESLSDRPRLGGNSDKYSRLETEHKSVFVEWVQNPTDGNARRRLDDAQHEMIEKKAVTIGTDSAGGYALPAEIASEVEERVTQLNPFRQICRVNRVGSSDYAHLVSRNAAGSGWVAETDSRSETTT